MKMEEQKSICLSGRPMGFLLFISREEWLSGLSPHLAVPFGNQPACGKRQSILPREITESWVQGRNSCAAEGRKGKYWLTCRSAETSSGKEGCGQSFIRIREKQKNKGMKDSRYPPPDAAGKGEEYMKKDLKRQIITALAVTAVLGAAGGMTAQAADEFVPGTVLASEDERNILANGTPTEENPYAGKKQYFYGVTGGNVYLDSNAKDLVGEINDVVNYKPKDFSNIGKGILAGMIRDKLPEEVPGIIEAVNDKTLPGSGTQTIKEGTTLNLKGYKDENGQSKDWVRYYGAIGGDAAVDTGLTGNLNFSILGIDKTYEAQEPTVIDRIGNVDVKIGSEAGAVSVIGGVGGSAAAALGNITVKASYSGLVSADLKLDGKTSATVNGNVNTVVDKNANVLGWMNGGLAAGIGGTASSTVTGNTTLTIDGTNRQVSTETIPDDDITGKILNVMKGSGINAVGVLGGGTAVTTLGGTATADVKGSTQIDVDDATVVGLIGGGAAASVDATGVGSALMKKPVGNDDGTSGFGITAEGKLETGNGDEEKNAPIHVDLTNVNQGGTATSTTGDTNITLTGKGTALGVLGGGAAVASHTYTWKNDGTVPSEDTPEGVYKGGEYGVSNATAKTGKSHIIINLNNDELDGPAKSAMLGDMKTFMAKVIKNTDDETNNLPDMTATELDDFANKGAAIGVFGGGAAIAQSGNQQFTNNAEGTLSKTDGAFATATTAGSDIELADGYIVGVMGGGIAAVDNNAAASSNMDGTVNITIGGYVDEEGNELDPEVIGVFGNGLAYYTGSSNGGNNHLKGQAVVSAEDTNILVRGGSVDGIIGGGVAIDDSQSNVTNASAVTNGTAAITVTGGTVNTVNLDTISSITSVNGVKAAAGNAAIAAGGIALGGGADAYVHEAEVNINGGTVDGDIYGGGIAAYGGQSVGGSHVDSSTINLNGGTVNGNVYAGGAASSKELPDHEGYTYAIATVDKAVINLAGAKVDGILYGTGTLDGAADGTSETASSTVKESTLNLIGKNELGLAGETSSKSSKIQNFTNVVAKAGSETVVTDADANTALISGGKVTVEDGASLNVEALDSTDGTYKIAANTTKESTFWKDSDLIYDRMGGYYATGVIGESNDSYNVNVAAVTKDNAEKAADSMTDALGVKDLRGMFREGMNDGWKKLNKDSGAGKYLDDWQMADNKAPYQKGMLFGEDAAVTGNTVSIARAMADNVTQRLSFTDDYVQEQGWANQDGGVWAKYMHRKYETDGMSSSVGGIRSGTDYDGILVGMDLAKNGKFQSGVAIHYGSGEGDGLISHNDYDAWGITLYGSLKDEEAGTNLMADIGWMTSDNDIDGTVNGTRMSANRDVDAWTIGIRGEKEFVSGKNQIVPYAGLRYMSVNPGSYTTYYGGKEAFHNDAENQDLWLLPIGVSFRNETVTNSGWKITPKLDLSYIWAFGDTDTDMTVNASGYTGSLYYDVMDDSSWLATLGVEAEKDAWTFGINYGYQKGDDTKNKTWYVTAGYSF